ncbi:hypothetical protein PQR53_07815 [Paraburkholderia fungorum]|uniref:hypothetical protein n=1 Tax=Paraburkholderia fungorum TaxID=134537 RepID=UPI0038BB8DD2
MTNKLSKLFTPRAPKPITFEDGQRVTFSFPQDYSKPQQAPVIPLIEQIRAAVKELSKQIAAIPESSPLDAANIDHLRDRVRASQKRVESAQAQCRAGLAEINTIKPLQDDTDALRNTLSSVLARRAELDKRVVLVARLRELQEAVQ